VKQLAWQEERYKYVTRITSKFRESTALVDERKE
jgi:hypothetical protein